MLINIFDFDVRLIHSLPWDLPLECSSPSGMFALGLVLTGSRFSTSFYLASTAHFDILRRKHIINCNFCLKYILLSWLVGKGKHYWEEENINEEMPACRQMFNIFHPFDPVAYR